MELYIYNREGSKVNERENITGNNDIFDNSISFVR